MPTEIKLLKVDKEKTKPVDSNPGMVDLYFELSEAPTSNWTFYFEGAWSSHIYSMKRRASCEGKYIHMIVGINDDWSEHRNELIGVIAETNKKVDKVSAEIKTQQNHKKEKEQKNLEIIKKKLEEL